MGLGTLCVIDTTPRDLTAAQLKALGVLRDQVMARMELQLKSHQLERAVEEITAAYKDRSDFLARMSHEIRTPLHGVIGMIELLRTSALDEDQKGLVSTMEISGRTLLEVINDVLDFSKFESEGIELESTPFQLQSLLLETMEIVRPLAHAKKLTLACEYEASQGEDFIGDPTRVRHIFLNLMSNAVKYTSSGGVTVRVVITKVDATSVVHVSVSDTGIGIESAMLSDVFKPFVQAEASTTRRFGGTGLGLSICTRLVELMGGEIKAKSEPGVGSTFTVSLPLQAGGAPEPQALPVASQSETTEAAYQGCSVLVADDNETNRVIASRMLAKLGVISQLADDGQSAVAAITTGTYDLILMDISMPVMDGFEAAAQIRERLGSLCPPILAMTASVTPEERAAFVEAGFDDTLAKPFTLLQLQHALEKHLHKLADSDESLIDEERLQSLLAYDAPGGPSLLELFEQEVVAHLATLEAAVAASDIDGTIRAAHSLRGLAANVGALALAASATEIEKAARAGSAAKTEEVEGLRRHLDRFLLLAKKQAA